MKLEEKNIREQRAKVWDGMKALIEAARTEDRVLTEAERTDYDARSAELDGLDGDLKRVMAHDERAKAEPGPESRTTDKPDAEDAVKRYERAFTGFLRHGAADLPTELRTALMERRTVLDAAGMTSSQADTAKAGYQIPQAFWQNLQIAMKAFGGTEALCNSITTSTGAPMPWPTVDPTAAVGSIIGTELTQVGFQDFVFGQGMLNAWTYTSNAIVASLQLVNDDAFDVDGFVRDRVAEAIGRAFAAHLISGSGTGQPLGVVTAASAFGYNAVGQNAGGTGAGALQSGGLVKSVNAGTVNTLSGTGIAKLANGLVAFSDILNMIASVDPAYRASGRCSWIASDTTLQMLRSVTDAYGHPLWEPNVQSSAPDSLYQYPIVVDQNVGAVSKTAATAGGLVFGDLKSAMIIRNVNQSDVMRLTERYADFLAVGYIGFVRKDARSNDMRAVSVYASSTS